MKIRTNLSKLIHFEINKLINYIYNINDKDKENNEINNNVPLIILVKHMLKLASFDKIISLINEKLIEMHMIMILSFYIMG